MYVPHVAIGCCCLDLAQDFYQKFPKCSHTRSYDDRKCFDFYGIQLVTHLSDQLARSQGFYPFHFGINFTTHHEFTELHTFLIEQNFNYTHGERFANTSSHHNFLSLTDPFGNFLEFKYYFFNTHGF